LAESKDVDTLSSELESRLDDLFGENNLPLPDAENSDPSAHYPLAELKNLMLSIDWEITDDVLEKLLQQIEDLKLTYKHDKIVLTFLQILGSLGDYIKTNRAQSHPKAFKILNSVFSSLDEVVLSKDMGETVKKKILRAEMNRYKELKAQISQSKTGGQRKPKAKPAPTDKPEIEEKREETSLTVSEPSVQLLEAEAAELPISDQDQEPDVVTLREPSVEALAKAVEEIKKYIHDEIKALKKEIKSLRDR
jgi:hypothetical protein